MIVTLLLLLLNLAKNQKILAKVFRFIVPMAMPTVFIAAYLSYWHLLGTFLNDKEVLVKLLPRKLKHRDNRQFIKLDYRLWFLIIVRFCACISFW